MLNRSTHTQKPHTNPRTANYSTDSKTITMPPSLRSNGGDHSETLFPSFNMTTTEHTKNMRFALPSLTRANGKGRQTNGRGPFHGQRNETLMTQRPLGFGVGAQQQQQAENPKREKRRARAFLVHQRN